MQRPGMVAWYPGLLCSVGKSVGDPGTPVIAVRIREYLYIRGEKLEIEPLLAHNNTNSNGVMLLIRDGSVRSMILCIELVLNLKETAATRDC